MRVSNTVIFLSFFVLLLVAPFWIPSLLASDAAALVSRARRNRSHEVLHRGFFGSPSILVNLLLLVVVRDLRPLLLVLLKLKLVAVVVAVSVG